MLFSHFPVRILHKKQLGIIKSGGIVNISCIIKSLYMGNAVLIPASAGDTAVLPKIVIMEIESTAAFNLLFFRSNFNTSFDS